MANYDVSNPIYNNNIRKLEKSDPAHANIFNSLFQQLLENDECLKKEKNELAFHSSNHEKDMNCHVTVEEKNNWTNGILSTKDREKLNGMAAGAEVNQNAFSRVKVGSALVEANSKTAQVEIAAGNNVSITGDNSNKKIIINVILPSSMPPSAHNQSAATITAGTFDGNVAVKAATDYLTSKLRNAKFSTSVPTSLANGEICFVYE